MHERGREKSSGSEVGDHDGGASCEDRGDDACGGSRFPAW